MTDYQPGIRHNLGQFRQQLLQVFFVGLTIGMQRTVVPVLAESEFGVSAGSAVLLGLVVDAFGAYEAAFWLTAVVMALSGLWVAIAMDETLATRNRAVTE